LEESPRAFGVHCFNSCSITYLFLCSQFSSCKKLFLYFSFSIISELNKEFSAIWLVERSLIWRGYYTVARRYEFYVRVARMRWSEVKDFIYFILFLPREHKIHIFELTCSSFYFINVLMTAFLTIFRRCPTTFRRFPKILYNLSEGHTNVGEQFSKVS